MNIQDIIEKLETTPGATRKVRWCSPVKTLKSVVGVDVFKITQAYVSAGTDFANRKEIREAIAAGERGEVQPLSWGRWVRPPFHIEHKGEDYIRLYPVTAAQQEAFHLAPTVTFLANGAEISREEAIALCGSAAKASDERPTCLSVKAANMVSID